MGGGSRKLYIVMRGDHFNKITFKRGGGGDRLNFIVFSRKSSDPLPPQAINNDRSLIVINSFDKPNIRFFKFLFAGLVRHVMPRIRNVLGTVG